MNAEPAHAIGRVEEVPMDSTGGLVELRCWCTCGDPVFRRLYRVFEPSAGAELAADRAGLGTSLAWAAHRAKVGAP